MSGWRLDSVEIKGFRGVAGKRRFDFLGRNGLLFGPNGQGKSTVPLAIHWALFGRFPDGILQNIKFNSFLPSAANQDGAYSVRLTLRRDGQSLTVYREEGTKRKRFELEADGVLYTDAEAVQKRDAILAMDLETFARLILLQQSRVRGLLMDEVGDRRKAMDKLLGIDTLAEIAAELKPKPFLDLANALLSGGREALIALEGEERKLVELREEAQETARKQGFQSRHFSLAGLKKEFEELSAGLAQIAESYGVRPVSLPACVAVEDGRRVCALVREAVAKVRAEADVRKRLASMDSEFATVAALANRWREIFEHKESGAQALRDHETVAGSQEDMERKAKSLADRFEQAKKDLASGNALKVLLGDALGYIEASAAKNCPVCERPMPLGGTEAIRERAAKLANETTQALERAKTEAREAADAHESLKRVRLQLVGECDDWKRRLEIVRGEALGILGGYGVADAKMAARLDEALASRQSEREQIALGARALEESLEKINQRTAAVSETLLPALALSTKLAAVEDERKQAARGGGAETRKAERFRALADDVAALKQVLLQAKDEHATASLNAAASRAQDLYSMLVDHPYFDKLKIETKEENKNVNYSYRVFKGAAAGDGAEARLVLSDGQMTAAALALFYALAESAYHAFDLLFIDDPTQNLDDKRKESMARAITQIAKLKQVVISTHDADFEAKLDDSGFKDGAACFRFRDWNGDPQVSAS